MYQIFVDDRHPSEQLEILFFAGSNHTMLFDDFSWDFTTLNVAKVFILNIFIGVMGELYVKVGFSRMF